MVRIAICDDDTLLTTDIEKLIYDCEKTEKLNVDVYFTGENLLQSIQQGMQYDLIYLDIEMGKLNGINTARGIRKHDKNCLIIYITSHTQFAISAFEVNAFRFLQKPIEKEKFKSYYKSAIAKISKSDNYFKYAFKCENFKIPIENILYFESEKRLINIMLADKSKKTFYMKLDAVEESLCKSNTLFYRISQSFLINPIYVYSYKVDKIVLKDGSEFQISRERRKKVVELFCDLKGGEIIDDN